MRWTIGVFTLAVIGLAATAVGDQPGCAGCNGGMTAGSWSLRGWDAEACASPGGYTLIPGCCEDHRRCCDNAWAGYCDHRAKVEAFWTRVGTPKPSLWERLFCRMPTDSCVVEETCSSDAAQPVPADPSPTPADMPAPPAEPDRTSRNTFGFLPR